uniref:Hydroxysteroid 17-beta dehydrogenase 1 n=1 Tax=Apteryx owenii TaxID=8824 RepID=A0A8B9S6W4_APTOW
MEKTTVLITGCSSGIGLALAARLASDAAQRFKGKGVTLRPCAGTAAGLGRWARVSPGTRGASSWRVPGRVRPSWGVQPCCRCPVATLSPAVFATMRDLAKGERLRERLGGCRADVLEVLQLDVTDPRSLAEAACRLQGQRLDVLGEGRQARFFPVRPWAGSFPGIPCPGHQGQTLRGARGRRPCRGWDGPRSAGHWAGRQVLAGGGAESGPDNSKWPHAPDLKRFRSVGELGGGRHGARLMAAPGRAPAVCNAGVGLMGPLETCSEQAMKSVFDVNLFGAVRTIQAFLPAMKRRRAGRIVISGSVGGLQGVPFNAVYCASKFAVEGLCESLAIVLQPFNIHVTLVECGPVNTSFLANLQRPDPEGAELQGLDAETRGLYGRYLRHCQSLFREAAQDVEEVVQVFLEALCSPRPPLRCVTTQRFTPLARLRLDSPDGSDFLRAMSAFVFGSDQA